MFLPTLGVEKNSNQKNFHPFLFKGVDALFFYVEWFLVLYSILKRKKRKKKKLCNHRQMTSLSHDPSPFLADVPSWAIKAASKHVITKTLLPATHIHTYS